LGESAPIVSLIPILTTWILFGLAMDYHMFRVNDEGRAGAGVARS
jgi:hypothetical protein